ncbi:hypothetical protein B0I35DRAFT_479511 [Stachybotrys elegans]|uniref:Uncharacterized protein n=1 Tax=Stachybotrys elegans TaxID=80388 RepID=A0A8K0SKA3_9HYPO|nr:hypothetical protein B0I35DRAFT_479511 [Stachybotrys elegans]
MAYEPYVTNHPEPGFSHLRSAMASIASAENDQTPRLPFSWEIRPPNHQEIDAVDAVIRDPSYEPEIVLPPGTPRKEYTGMYTDTGPWLDDYRQIYPTLKKYPITRTGFDETSRIQEIIKHAETYHKPIVPDAIFDDHDLGGHESSMKSQAISSIFTPVPLYQTRGVDYSWDFPQALPALPYPVSLDRCPNSENDDNLSPPLSLVIDFSQARAPPRAKKAGSKRKRVFPTSALGTSIKTKMAAAFSRVGALIRRK